MRRRVEIRPDGMYIITTHPRRGELALLFLRSFVSGLGSAIARFLLWKLSNRNNG